MSVLPDSAGALAVFWRRTSKRIPVESRLLVLLAIVAMGSLLFLHLASEISEGDTMAFDRAILLAFRVPGEPSQPAGPHWLLKVMTEMTVLGGGTILTTMTAMVGAYLLAAGRRRTALVVIAAVSGGAILSTILKHIFERPRPELVAHFVNVNSASFPSGHAMNSAVIYLTLATLLAKTERSRAVRIYLISMALLLTLIIGVSRVYLGVHWPTDVIAGWCVGSLWALLCSLVADRFQRRRSLPHGT